MNKRQFVEEVIEHLRGLADGDLAPENTNFGLCVELEDIYGMDFLRMDCAFKEWPENSGRTMFPVPHPELPSLMAFNEVEELWGDTEYGDARRRLCDHCADWLEENIEELINWRRKVFTHFDGAVPQFRWE